MFFNKIIVLSFLNLYKSLKLSKLVIASHSSFTYRLTSKFSFLSKVKMDLFISWVFDIDEWDHGKTVILYVVSCVEKRFVSFIVWDPKVLVVYGAFWLSMMDGWNCEHQSRSPVVVAYRRRLKVKQNGGGKRVNLSNLFAVAAIGANRMIKRSGARLTYDRCSCQKIEWLFILVDNLIHLPLANAPLALRSRRRRKIFWKTLQTGLLLFKVESFSFCTDIVLFCRSMCRLSVIESALDSIITER